MLNNLNSPENRQKILDNFPKLVGDPNWEVSSPEDKAYNCFAWACGKNTIQLSPYPSPYLDSVYWPNGIPFDVSPETLVALFKLEGYGECDNMDYEEGFQKIALYIKDNTCTHAGRMLTNGMWSSKLGMFFFDIFHTHPTGIENDIYGEVKIFMKRKHSGFIKDRLRK